MVDAIVDLDRFRAGIRHDPDAGSYPECVDTPGEPVALVVRSTPAIRVVGEQLGVIGS